MSTDSAAPVAPAAPAALVAPVAPITPVAPVASVSSVPSTLTVGAVTAPVVSPAKPTRATGPRTAAGKARASRNALVHGLYSDRLLVADEETRAFEAYRRELLLEVNPASTRELDLFQRLLAVNWKLRRVELAEPLIYDDGGDAGDHADDGGEASDPGGDERLSCLDADVGDIDGLFAPAVGVRVGRRTLACFGDLERVHGHQVRLQNAAHRCWRELDRLREQQRKHKQQDRDIGVEAPEPEPLDGLRRRELETAAGVRVRPTPLVVATLRQWRRDARSARQRRWRARRRAVDAAVTTAIESVTSSEATTVDPPAPRRALQPPAAAMLRRAAGLADDAPVAHPLDTARLLGRRRFGRNEPPTTADVAVHPVIAMSEAELTPWPDPVVAPNGELIDPALLDYLREYRPDAPELQPRSAPTPAPAPPADADGRHA